MNNEIMKSADAPRVHKPWWPPKKTAEERREKHIVKGTCGIVQRHWFDDLFVLLLRRAGSESAARCVGQDSV